MPTALCSWKLGWHLESVPSGVFFLCDVCLGRRIIKIKKSPFGTYAIGADVEGTSCPIRSGRMMKNINSKDGFYILFYSLSFNLCRTF